MLYTAKELAAQLHARMTGKGQSLGTITATSDPNQQHLIGVERFLKYEPDDELLAVIWSRHDMPESWDALMKVWHHRDNDEMVAATRQVIEHVLDERTTEEE